MRRKAAKKGDFVAKNSENSDYSAKNSKIGQKLSKKQWGFAKNISFSLLFCFFRRFSAFSYAFFACFCTNVKKCIQK